MDGKRWAGVSLAGIIAAVVTLSQTNPDMLTKWLGLLYSVPVPVWALILAAITGWVFPWLVESKVPMADWQGWQFALTVYGLAIILSGLATLAAWHSWYAPTGCVVGLLVQMVRDVLSRMFPVLSPTQQIKVGRNAAGETTVKIGSDPTLVAGRPAPAGPPTVPGAARVAPTDIH